MRAEKLTPGALFHAPFVFGDGCCSDGKRRPVIVVSSCEKGMIISPLSCEMSPRRDGTLIFLVTPRDFFDLSLEIVSGVIVAIYRLIEPTVAEIRGRLCRKKLALLEYNYKQSLLGATA